MVKHEIPVDKPAEVQGSLIKVDEHTSGETDPGMQTTIQTYTPSPEGVYPTAPEAIPEPDPDPETQAFWGRVHEAVKTDNRRRAQMGKHSTIGDDGKHSDVRAGKYLPDDTPVTYTNIAESERRAAELDKEEHRRK